ncbi:TonB-dependent receptor [Novacetimonas hansenii]|uniref:TonB-dependent receptor n=1 Tax=Novacetimonas hansenii TaxID=436 RepID=A0ABQ0SG50_NOVHA|nr:TonB-dependent receptor [Novacetimonas hansenii JCM 7643]GEC64077.1 TonB-dependent receptor [Novacetimonas hansenii]
MTKYLIPLTTLGVVAPAMAQVPQDRVRTHHKKTERQSGLSVPVGVATATAGNLTPGQTERINVRAVHSGTEAAALDEQRRSVGVASVMSREQLERAPETNLSDILTRLPGVSAYSDMGGGQAATGESQYMTIRGLDSSYNAYTLNGERIAPADPSTRAISFDMLAPYGITSIKVSKSTTADMDGDAIGGAIDIRTPTAFDFSGPYQKVTLQGQLNDKAAQIGTQDLGGTAQVEFARRFGKDGQFGIYATGYYSSKNVLADAVSPNTAYAPTLLSQAGVTSLNQASQLSTQQLKYDLFSSAIKRYGGSLSLNYKGDNQEVYFLGTYGQYNVQMNDNQVSLRGADPSYNANGIYQSADATRGQYFETDDSAQLLTTQKLGGITRTDDWTINYDVFNSYGVQSSPNQVEASMYGNTTVTGPFMSDVANTTLPRLMASSAAMSQLYNQNTDRFWKTQGRDSQSTADMFGIHADAAYRFHSDILKSVVFGFKISDTQREAWRHPYFHDDNNFVYDGPFFGGENWAYNNAAGPVIGNIPGRNVNAFSGAAGDFRLLDRDWVKNTTVPYKYQNDPNGAGNYTKNDWNANTSRGSERIYAGFVELNLQAGPVDIHPGFRYEYTDFDGSHWKSNGDDATGEFIKVRQSYGMPLPYLNINYRPTDYSVLRFSVRRSLTRPAFGLINGATSLTLDSLTNRVISVSQPNPNLRPTTANVFDLSGELYNRHSGVLSASLYYKQIQKFIFTSVSGTSNSATLGGNVPTNAYTNNGTEYQMPMNGGSAILEGIELNAQQPLYFLPRWLSGFGVNGNVTLQHSNAKSNVTGHPDTALPRAPSLMYNVGVFYNRGPVHFDLNYNYTGTQLLSVNSSLPDFYLQPTRRLDLSVKYKFGWGLTGTLAMQNLLNTPAYWETMGKKKTYLAYDGSANGAFVQTGRMYLVGLSGQF